MKGDRNEERNLCADLLKVRWKDSQGRTRREMACLEDISPGGVCLQVQQVIEPGTMVSILYPKGLFRGEVKYCIYQETGYFLGVEFSPGYRWTQKIYKPSHLVQFRMRPTND